MSMILPLVAMVVSIILLTMVSSILLTVVVTLILVTMIVTVTLFVRDPRTARGRAGPPPRAG